MPRQGWNWNDPRGRNVRLNQGTWDKHICGPDGHIEMAANFDAISETICDPDRISESGTRYPDREIYERMREFKGYARPRRLIATVVVKWRSPKRGIRPRRRAPIMPVGDIVTGYASGTQHQGATTWQRGEKSE